MGAYLSSDQLPIVLHFTDLEPLTLREAVKTWITEGRVVHLDMGGDDPMPNDLAGALFNFGAMPLVWVSGAPPETDKFVLDLQDTDLEAL